MECAWSLLNYGNSLLYNENFDEAYRILSESIELNDSVLKPELRPHSYSLTAYHNRALIALLKGNRDLSELESIYKYKEKKNGKGHPYNANTLICMGSAETDVAQSIRYYERALSILEHGQYVYGPDHCFVRLCLFIRQGHPKEELPSLLSEYNAYCLNNPDLSFLIDCINGKRARDHTRLAVSHNNGSELLCFPLDIFSEEG